MVVLGTAAASAKTITVQPGDSLWAIARRHGTDVATIRSLNSLTSDALQPGQLLTVPGEDDAQPPTVVVVQAGDTLFDIALANNVTVEDLIAFNNLDGTLIHPAQELRLAAGDKVPDPLVVTVNAGDSLWALARRFDTTVAAIAAANGIAATATLSVGAKLTIPGQYASATTETDVGGPAPMTVVVGPGDTLWSLAQRYDSTVAALKSANSLKGDSLFVGQQLRILPGKEIAPTRAVVQAPAAPAASEDALLWPLIGNITSRYGYRQLRVSGSNFHSGLDIDGETGDPIRAAHAGTVTFAGWHGGYGYLVIVTSGNTEYYYAHASAVKVAEGDRVAAGDVVALVGSTGNSTGSHLHFEIRVDGETIDPLPVLETHAAR